GVLRVPARILALGGRVLADDGVLEAGLLERRAPVLDALLHVGPPFLRHLATEVEDDRLDRLGDFLARILLLHAEARDVLAAFHPAAPRGIVLERAGEVADSRVGVAA